MNMKGDMRTYLQECIAKKCDCGCHRQSKRPVVLMKNIVCSFKGCKKVVGQINVKGSRHIFNGTYNDGYSNYFCSQAHNL